MTNKNKKRPSGYRAHVHHRPTGPTAPARAILDSLFAPRVPGSTSDAEDPHDPGPGLRHRGIVDPARHHHDPAVAGDVARPRSRFGYARTVRAHGEPARGPPGRFLSPTSRCRSASSACSTGFLALLGFIAVRAIVHRGAHVMAVDVLQTGIGIALVPGSRAPDPARSPLAVNVGVPRSAHGQLHRTAAGLGVRAADPDGVARGRRLPARVRHRRSRRPSDGASPRPWAGRPGGQDCPGRAT